MTTKLFFLTILNLLFFFSAFAQNISYTARPAWVKPSSIPKKIPDTNSQAWTQKVYQNIQHNYATDEKYNKTAYKIYAVKPTTQPLGYRYNYNPKDKQLYIISIYILRGTQKIELIDRFKTTFYQHQDFIRNQFYNNATELAFFLDDLQHNDIIVFESLEKNLRKDIYQLAISEIDLIRNIENDIRIISQEPLTYKTLNTILTPVQSQTKWGYELQWQGIPKTNAQQILAPQSYYTQPIIRITPFQDIEELLSWKIPFYETDSLSRVVVQKKLGQLSSTDAPISQKITNIINYVQDSIKYLEYSLYDPYSPERVVADGYGDCKSKSLLGVSLLNEAGIPAWPIAVNSPSYNYQFEEIITPQKFNHCVIQFVHEEDTITVDPTISQQTDVIGKYYLPPFQLGLPMKEEVKKEVEIPAQGIHKISVFDHYDFQDDFKRTVIFEGHEATRMRKQLHFKGKTSLKQLFNGQGHDMGHLYSYFFDLGLGYFNRWRVQDSTDIQVIDQHPIQNRIVIRTTHKCYHCSEPELPNFDLSHFQKALEVHNYDVPLKQPISIRKRDIYHQLTLQKTGINTLILDTLHFVSLDTTTSFCSYQAKVKLHEDSLVLTQSLKTTDLLSPDEYVNFFYLSEEVNTQRKKLASIPSLLNSYILSEAKEREANFIYYQIFAVIIGLLIAFVSIVGIVDLFKKIKRKISLRKTLPMLLLLFFSQLTYAQNLNSSSIPNWVKEYPEATETPKGEGIIQIRKEIQINELTKEIFHRNTYRVMGNTVSGSTRFDSPFDNSLQKISIHDLKVQRGQQSIHLLNKHLRFSSIKEEKQGVVFQQSKSFHFWNDDFIKGDLFTISYTISFQDGKEPPFTDHYVELNNSKAGCQYIISIIHHDNTLHYYHSNALKTPSSYSANGTTRLEWNQYFAKNERLEAIRENAPRWYYPFPQLFIYSFPSEQALAQSLQQKALLNDTSLTSSDLDRLLATAIPQNVPALLDSLTQVSDYLQKKFFDQHQDDIIKLWSLKDVLQTGYASAYHKAILMSKLLDHLSIENELFLVRKNGLNHLLKGVLSRHVFTHGIVRYRLNGQLCYFDPILDNRAPTVDLRRKVAYKYGLNLTSPQPVEQLQEMENTEENRLVFYDSLQTNGRLYRKLIATGALAELIRNQHYTPKVELKELFEKGIPYSSDQEGKNSILITNQQILFTELWQDNIIDSLRLTELPDRQLQVELYGQLQLNNNIPYHSYQMLQDVYPDYLLHMLQFGYLFNNHDYLQAFPKIQFEQHISIPDTLLRNESLPKLDLSSDYFSFKRHFSFTDSTANIHHYFNSTTDYVDSSMNDPIFWDNMQHFDSQKYFTLENLKKQPLTFWDKNQVTILVGASLLLWFFPLYGTWVCIKWMRKKYLQRKAQ